MFILIDYGLKSQSMGKISSADNSEGDLLDDDLQGHVFTGKQIFVILPNAQQKLGGGGGVIHLDTSDTQT